VDPTLIILHSGNYEYVAVRHRETQTLFLSDIYEPYALIDPGYGKLHIGIYISAVQDALDRFNKLPKDTNPPSPLEDDGSEDRGDRDDGNAKRSDKKGKGRGQGGSEDRRRGGRGRQGGSRGHSASRVSGIGMAESQFAVCQLYMSGL
jgi:hypothetical protein